MDNPDINIKKRDRIKQSACVATHGNSGPCSVAPLLLIDYMKWQQVMNEIKRVIPYSLFSILPLPSCI